MPEPKYSEMMKVRVVDPKQPPASGFVIGSLFRNGEWLYKVSLPDLDFSEKDQTFDNWYKESALERC